MTYDKLILVYPKELLKDIKELKKWKKQNELISSSLSDIDDLLDKENDKNTVIALREIGEGKISLKTVEDTAINKLRKARSEPTELEDLDIEQDDDFNKIYKGEISKSGAAILPSKRVRRIPEKITISPKVEDEKKEEDIKRIDEQSKNKSLLAENKTE